MNTLTINGRTVRYGRFLSSDNARRFADRTTNMAVMLGDAGEYWVATLADCERLAKAGYEWA